MSLEKTKKDALDWIESNKESVVKVSDEVWDYSELGFIEHRVGEAPL